MSDEITVVVEAPVVTEIGVTVEPAEATEIGVVVEDAEAGEVTVVAEAATVIEVAVVVEPVEVAEITVAVEPFPPGADGADGVQNVFVQEAQPVMAEPGLWVELNGDLSVKTMWAGTT